jgi:hypothetical protein
MIVSSLTLGIFLMHRIRNVLTNRVLKKWSGLLRIRSCRIARNLGDHGTWLLSGQQSRMFIRSLCLQLPSTVLSLLHN